MTTTPIEVQCQACGACLPDVPRLLTPPSEESGRERKGISTEAITAAAEMLAYVDAENGTNRSTIGIDAGMEGWLKGDRFEASTNLERWAFREQYASAIIMARRARPDKYAPQHYAT